MSDPNRLAHSSDVIHGYTCFPGVLDASSDPRSRLLRPERPAGCLRQHAARAATTGIGCAAVASDTPTAPDTDAAVAAPSAASGTRIGTGPSLRSGTGTASAIAVP
jgi:hypothetical protein